MILFFHWCCCCRCRIFGRRGHRSASLGPAGSPSEPVILFSLLSLPCRSSISLFSFLRSLGFSCLLPVLFVVFLPSFPSTADSSRRQLWSDEISNASRIDDIYLLVYRLSPPPPQVTNLPADDGDVAWRSRWTFTSFKSWMQSKSTASEDGHWRTGVELS